MTLLELGWRPFFERHFEQLPHDDLVPARVVRHNGNRYQIRNERGGRTAVLAGRLLEELHTCGEAVTVGDWVAVERRLDEETTLIQAVLPRHGAFCRKEAGAATRLQVLAANVDTLFVMSGLDADFNLRRIERYVTQAWDSGATPVVLLNKADVCDDVEGRVLAAEGAAAGVDVHPISAATGGGLEALQPYLGTGRTAALVGSSGVGKSTLVNRLLGKVHLRTQAVREDDSRGRHTTTHRELLVLPSGGLLIDTPGLRELQLWSEPGSLRHTFPEIEDLAAACRFRDCTHEHEPGCAVQAALREGTLDVARLRSYRKLLREMAYLERRQNEAAGREERLRWKALTKQYHRTQRNNPKNR